MIVRPSVRNSDRRLSNKALWLLVLLAGVFMIPACTSTTGPIESHIVRLQTDRPSYGAGDTVMVRVQNISLEPVKFSACSIELQRKDGSGWKTLAHDWTCVSNLQLIPAGEATEVWLDLPAGLPGGIHRFHFPGLYDGTEARLDVGERLSNEFVVAS